MKCVYILESISDPSQRYVGLTGNLQSRLKTHNAGKVPHTSNYLPWKLRVAVHVDDDRAASLECYLKSGSGRAFSLRHLL